MSITMAETRILQWLITKHYYGRFLNHRSLLFVVPNNNYYRRQSVSTFRTSGTFATSILSTEKRPLPLVTSKFTEILKQPSNPIFTSSTCLSKRKKHFKYDPNFKREKKEKKKNANIDTISALTLVESYDKEDNNIKNLFKIRSSELELEVQANDIVPLNEASLMRTLKRRKTGSGSGDDLVRLETIMTEEAQGEIQQLLNKYPKLKAIGTTDLLDYLEFMTMYGFRPIQCAEMAILHPSILSNYENSIHQSVQTWRSFGYSEKDILTLLHFYPQLVDFPSLELRTRFSFISSYLTKNETMFAIVNSIQIIYDNESLVKKKLDYLIKSVCHSTKAISQSIVLTFSLKHIQFRHEFLIRAGLFQSDNYLQFHKKLYMINPKMPRGRYFLPADIVCTNDKDYLRICTNNLLSLNELVAFEELYEKEKEREALLMSDSEDEEELEDDDNGSSDDEEFGREMNLDPAQSANSSGFFNRKDASEFYY